MKARYRGLVKRAGWRMWWYHGRRPRPKRARGDQGAYVGGGVGFAEPSKPGYWTFRQVAKKLGIVKWTLYLWRKQGKIEGVWDLNRWWLTAEEVEQVRVMYERSLRQRPEHGRARQGRLDRRDVAW